MYDPSKNIISFFRGIGMFIIALLLYVIFLMFTTSCSVIVPHSAKDIPDEPTIWVVSEVDALEYRFGKGFVFYKMVPVNPGGLNARYSWIMDIPGKYSVGQKLEFSPLESK